MKPRKPQNLWPVASVRLRCPDQSARALKHFAMIIIGEAFAAPALSQKTPRAMPSIDMADTVHEAVGMTQRMAKNSSLRRALVGSHQLAKPSGSVCERGVRGRERLGLAQRDPPGVQEFNWAAFVNARFQTGYTTDFGHVFCVHDRLDYVPGSEALPKD